VRQLSPQEHAAAKILLTSPGLFREGKFRLSTALLYPPSINGATQIKTQPATHDRRNRLGVINVNRNYTRQTICAHPVFKGTPKPLYKMSFFIPCAICIAKNEAHKKPNSQKRKAATFFNFLQPKKKNTSTFIYFFGALPGRVDFNWFSKLFWQWSLLFLKEAKNKKRQNAKTLCFSILFWLFVIKNKILIFVLNKLKIKL